MDIPRLRSDIITEHEPSQGTELTTFASYLADHLLGVRRWFLPGTPVSSTTYNWLVTN